MSLVTFYHYTSKEGLEAITDSGFIQQSFFNGKDAAFGEGVYGTSLPPEAGRKKIAQNNWGPFWEQHEYAGKVDRAIELQIPKSRVERAKSDRNILIHKGPIDLDDYNWKVWILTSSDDDDDDDEDDEDEVDEEDDEDESDEDYHHDDDGDDIYKDNDDENDYNHNDNGIDEEDDEDESDKDYNHNDNKDDGCTIL